MWQSVIDTLGVSLRIGSISIGSGALAERVSGMFMLNERTANAQQRCITQSSVITTGYHHLSDDLFLTS